MYLFIINDLQTIWEMSVIRILAEYKWKAATKIHWKESQPHFSGFCLIFLVSLVSRCVS